MAENILVVDDEREIADLVEVYLQNEGYTVYKFYNAGDALNCLETTPISLAVLDIMLPDMDGFALCRRIRQKFYFPIIMLTAKVEDLDKIMGLTVGADDYITKPFSVREVVARVKANLRKSETHYDSLKSSHDSDSHKETKKLNTIKIGDLTLDLEKYEVNVNGTIVNLTLREFEVLKYLAQQQGQVVTRESLLEQVWGYEYYGDIRTVDVTVRRIRERIEKDTSNPKYLITKRGIGYYIPNFEK